jgi:hypothetical protein
MSNGKELPIFNANHHLNIPCIVLQFQIGNRQLEISQFALFSSSEHREVNYA